MERIVNLHYEDYPTLFKYVLKNKRDIVVDKWKYVYINVSERDIENLRTIKELEQDIEGALSSHICSNCGTRTTDSFKVTYRAANSLGESIGKSVDCPICWNMNDRYFWKVVGAKGTDKHKLVKEFIDTLN